MPDIAILAAPPVAAPEQYAVPGAQDLILKSARAAFDGTGAAGSYVPTLRILTSNGQPVAECPCGTTLAAGASADVSWFPRGGVSAGAGGSGIQFNTDNEGGWLDVTANAKDANGAGIDLEDASGGYTRIQNGSQRLDLSRSGNIALLLGNTATLEGNPIANLQTLGSAANLVVQTIAGLGVVSMQAKAVNGSVTLQDTAGGALFRVNTPLLGFHNVAPVARAAHPVTLADVITLLTNLGLCS